MNVNKIAARFAQFFAETGLSAEEYLELLDSTIENIENQNKKENKMKLKNAGFTYVWEAIKFIEEGKGGVFNSDGIQLYINPILSNDIAVARCIPRSIQIEDLPTWQEECIENGYPCMFWGNSKMVSYVGNLHSFTGGGSSPFYSKRNECWSHCRPIRPDECYPGKLD